MSFTVAADPMCSSPGQTLSFPGDGLSHSDPGAQECRRLLQPEVTTAGGWQGLGQRRDHCGCRYLLGSYSLCQVCYCLRILKKN